MNPVFLLVQLFYSLRFGLCVVGYALSFAGFKVDTGSNTDFESAVLSLPDTALVVISSFRIHIRYLLDIFI